MNGVTHESAGVAAVDIGFVFALAREQDPFLERCTRVKRIFGTQFTVTTANVGEVRLAMILSGPGRIAGAAAQVLIDGHQPRLVVSAGYAGGLSARFPLHAAADIARVRGAHQPEPISLVTPSDAGGAADLISLDQIAGTAREKRTLHESTGAELVDMETYAVAAACRRRDAACAGVRIVSDAYDTDLPSEVTGLFQRTGARQWGFALASLWKRPSLVQDLWSLNETTAAASDKLATALLERIPKWSGGMPDRSIIRTGLWDENR